jgi:hypothetical protein
MSGLIIFQTEPLFMEYCHDTAFNGRVVMNTFPVDEAGSEEDIVDVGNVTSKPDGPALLIFYILLCNI